MLAAKFEVGPETLERPHESAFLTDRISVHKYQCRVIDTNMTIE